jgi:hypothetical protein
MVAALIDETGHSGGPSDLRTTLRRTTMLKTISAALLAISVIAAPAMAAGTAKTAPIAKTAQAPAINAAKAKPAVMNANARMGKHHHRSHRHHAKHTVKHMGAIKAHKFSKVSGKHVTHAAKRG